MSASATAPPVPAPGDPAPFPAIPYGRGNFRAIRLDGCLYVDKTRFIRTLEQEGRYAFFIRPRRFGKSLWLTMLNAYYNRVQASCYDAVFAGTEVGANPTPNRSRYVTLYFDFSAFKQALPTLEIHFEEYCTRHLRHMLRRNRDLFDEETARVIVRQRSISGQLDELFLYVSDQGIPLYVLIDEYDNFANTVLAHRGADAYHLFTHGDGFYRNFFGTLKAGTTETGAIERLFVTGVSPITMDDVTSGFNVGSNLSPRPEFNEMLGFTEDEVRGMIGTYRDLGVFDRDPEAALATMREWYDGYRFAETAPNFVYNTDMVLYYLQHSVPNKPGPDKLIDPNVRIDYGKLRHLLTVEQEMNERQLNGNFDLLRGVIAEGRADSEIVDRFPLARLAERENFLSLLHYFGLLSIRGVTAETPRLAIPNQTVRRLLYGFLRDAYRDVRVFSLDLVEFRLLTQDMALEGAWRPAIERLSAVMAEQTSVRDYLQGEKMVQGFVAAYLSISRYFVIHTEMELAKGYADLVLEPLRTRSPGMRYGYVIELKYLRRGASEAQVAAAAATAGAQARRYLADGRLAQRDPETAFKGLALVFCGWELVHAAEAAAGAGAAVPPPAAE